MPAARGVKRAASKATAPAAAGAPKNKKKRSAAILEVPSAPKRRGCVFTCGQGDVGQLGLGEDVIETTKFKQVSGLGDKIVDVCAGGMHTVALDSDGKVWTFGCNDEGALGRATSGEAEEGRPRGVRLPAAARAVCAGDSHSAALLAGGAVYAWGAFRDSHGSMGLVIRGKEGAACKEPVKIDIDEPAAEIASGGDHLVVLTTSGNIYTMGCGEQGQLGRLPQRSASREARNGFSALLHPNKVSLKGGAVRVWAGYHGTFAMDASSRMLAWGLNNYGQLGITGDDRKTTIFTPTECDAFAEAADEERKPWKQVASGQHHSLVLDHNGKVYSIGRCEYGRLGLGEGSGDAEHMKLIPKLQNKKCISIACGTSSSFAVTDSGETLSWGMGSEGQLGCGGTDDESEPRPAVTVAAAQYTTPVHVSAGGQHTVLLIESPTAAAEPAATPEPEATEMIVDAATSTNEKEAKGPQKPTKGRQKKQDQEEEVSSTSSARPQNNADVTDNTTEESPAAATEAAAAPEPEPTEMIVDAAISTNEKKVNGDDNTTPTPMEVNETETEEGGKIASEKPDDNLALTVQEPSTAVAATL